MDTYFVKIQGKCNIPSPMEIGKNYEIEAKGSVTQKKEDDNFDGSLNVTFKFEPITIDIKDELGATIKAKDPRRNSVKFRSYAFKMYVDLGVIYDFSLFYDELTLVAMSRMTELVTEAVKRLDKRND